MMKNVTHVANTTVKRSKQNIKSKFSMCSIITGHVGLQSNNQNSSYSRNPKQNYHIVASSFHSHSPEPLEININVTVLN